MNSHTRKPFLDELYHFVVRVLPQSVTTTKPDEEEHCTVFRGALAPHTGVIARFRHGFSKEEDIPKLVHGATFQAKVAIETIKGEKAIAELASEFGVPPVQVSRWKKQFLEGAAEVFSEGRKARDYAGRLGGIPAQTGSMVSDSHTKTLPSGNTMQCRWDPSFP